MSAPDLARWRSYHLFYHGDRDRLLLEVVAPLVETWRRQGAIDGFFFVRFALGGPHVRLRLRLAAGARDAGVVDLALRDRAADFFARVPSAAALDPEAIRRANQPLLASDPFETDDAVYPDQTCHLMPCRLDVERYGGAARFGASLALFEASSDAALALLGAGAAASPAARLSAAGRALLAQALGTAAGEAELLQLLDYGVTHWGEPLARMVAEADLAFERRPEALRGLARSVVEALRDPAATGAADGPLRAPLALAAAARRLSRGLRRADAATRQRIGWSQLHMTANRLGLDNPHEVYLSRQLGKAARSLAANEPALWRATLPTPTASRQRAILV